MYGGLQALEPVRRFFSNRRLAWRTTHYRASSDKYAQATKVRYPKEKVFVHV